MDALTIGKIHALLSEDERMFEVIGSDAELYQEYQSLAALVAVASPRQQPIDISKVPGQRVVEQFNRLVKLAEQKHGIVPAYHALIGHRVLTEVLPLPIVDETFEETIVVPPVS